MNGWQDGKNSAIVFTVGAALAAIIAAKAAPTDTKPHF